MISQSLASVFGQAREVAGTTITVAGKPYRAVTRSLDRAERELLPEGAVNAAAADLRRFNCSPSDLPVPPDVGTPVIWNGVTYEVVFAAPGDLMGQRVAMRLICVIQPPSDLSSADPVTGDREDYTSADATF